jgi:hypothetical protein
MNEPVRLPEIGQNGQPINPNGTTSIANSRNNSLAGSSSNVRNNSNNNQVTNNNGERLPPLQNLGLRGNPHNQTSASNMSENSKKILRWHLWWNKQNSDMRIPLYEKPNKNVDSRIGSLQNVTYRPGNIKKKKKIHFKKSFIQKIIFKGGGNVQLIDEKLTWSKQSRIDAKNTNYKRGGGNRQILSEKLQWNKQSKINSLGL